LASAATAEEIIESIYVFRIANLEWSSLPPKRTRTSADSVLSPITTATSIQMA
jgi:hypothetical protein